MKRWWLGDSVRFQPLPTKYPAAAAAAASAKGKRTGWRLASLLFVLMSRAVASKGEESVERREMMRNHKLPRRSSARFWHLSRMKQTNESTRISAFLRHHSLGAIRRHRLIITVYGASLCWRYYNISFLLHRQSFFLYFWWLGVSRWHLWGRTCSYTLSVSLNNSLLPHYLDPNVCSAARLRRVLPGGEVNYRVRHVHWWRSKGSAPSSFLLPFPPAAQLEIQETPIALAYVDRKRDCGANSAPALWIASKRTFFLLLLLILLNFFSALFISTTRTKNRPASFNVKISQALFYKKNCPKRTDYCASRWYYTHQWVYWAKDAVSP